MIRRSNLALLLLLLAIPTGVRSAPIEMFAGAASCSGRGCHGALTANESGVQQNEFATWLRHDKHAQAFEALLSPRAKQMAQNLAPTNADRKPIAADNDVRCLACHTTPELAFDLPTEQQRHGVGCEACHGPAKLKESWLTAHTTKAWQQAEGKAKEDLYRRTSMNNLADPLVQAQVLRRLPRRQRTGRDQWPAAPRTRSQPRPDGRRASASRLRAEHLRHEHAAALAPDKHKDEPGYEARLWTVGRFESARAALELLQWRTSEENHRQRWPEFAEADCFSCHARLRPEHGDWRKNKDYLDRDIRKPGALPYSVLYSTRLPDLATVFGEKDEPLRKEFAELGRLIGRQEDNRKAVYDRAGRAIESLTPLNSKANATAYDAARMKGAADRARRQGRPPGRPELG